MSGVAVFWVGSAALDILVPERSVPLQLLLLAGCLPVVNDGSLGDRRGAAMVIVQRSFVGYGRHADQARHVPSDVTGRRGVLVRGYARDLAECSPAVDSLSNGQPSLIEQSQSVVRIADACDERHEPLSVFNFARHDVIGREADVLSGPECLSHPYLHCVCRQSTERAHRTA